MISPLSEALASRGYETLTPVQKAVTEPGLEEADLLVSAQTGSGKTVGFGLAIAPTLLGGQTRFGPAGAPTALVVAPTRELAFQVMQELRWLYENTGAMVNACVGGMDVRQERRLLERGTHIVVGTPGRLCDHIRRGALDLGSVRAVVLDEADEMLDLGFREDLEFILSSAPAERRTLLFSATVSPVIAKLAEKYQRDARRINTIDKALQHADIAYTALRVAATDTDHAIFNLLRYHGDESAIVFANTRATVNHLSARLTNRGLPVVTLSGELSQTERSHALQAMRDGRARVCVATDVAARGIDLPNLNLVIHADLPTNTESLLHRSGRTGRAGRKGISALIVPPRMVKRAQRLLQWAKIKAEWDVPPSAEEIIARDEERLLNDPAWNMDIDDGQRAFAMKLLERHGPEAVAAALVRMHQARHAAPEDLESPDVPPKREPRDFGPSRWFSLSVGREDRAEPRWLLPMILKATSLDKSAIGAIRVQDRETFVEIAEGSAARFEAAMSGGDQSDGVTARPLDGAPQMRKPARPRAESRPEKTRAPARDDKPAPARQETRNAAPDTASPKEGRPAPAETALNADTDGQDATRQAPKSRRVLGATGDGSSRTAATTPGRGSPAGDAPARSNRKPSQTPAGGRGAKFGRKPAAWSGGSDRPQRPRAFHADERPDATRTDRPLRDGPAKPHRKGPKPGGDGSSRGPGAKDGPRRFGPDASKPGTRGGAGKPAFRGAAGKGPGKSGPKGGKPGRPSGPPRGPDARPTRKPRS